MKRENYKTITSGKGEMHVYDWGDIKLHAYKTNDPLSDEVFVLEKSGEAVLIEAPCFADNIHELAGYIDKLNVKVAGKLLAYHMAGASFVPTVPVYATENADDYGHAGGGKALIDNFAKALGESFDASVADVTNIIASGPLTLGGIRLNIAQTDEAFDIEIPQINAVYTHMLGHDCHSIVAGAGHAGAIVAQLEGYLGKGYDLVLTSHYSPEDLKGVETKIAYLKDLIAIAKACGDAEAFKQAVEQRYPAYGGGNYLDIDGGLLFPRHITTARGSRVPP